MRMRVKTKSGEEFNISDVKSFLTSDEGKRLHVKAEDYSYSIGPRQNFTLNYHFNEVDYFVITEPN
mgnify:CR=1 FL=1